MRSVGNYLMKKTVMKSEKRRRAGADDGGEGRQAGRQAGRSAIASGGGEVMSIRLVIDVSILRLLHVMRAVHFGVHRVSLTLLFLFSSGTLT